MSHVNAPLSHAAVAFLQPSQPPICTHSSGSSSSVRPWAHAARSYFDGRAGDYICGGDASGGAADHYRAGLCLCVDRAAELGSPCNLARESRPIPLRVLHALYMRAAVKVRAALIQFSLAPQPPQNSATATIAGTTGPGSVGVHPCWTFAALWGRSHLKD